MRRPKIRFTYANVAATVALFLALSGTSYALVITSTSIKNNTITGVDIKDESISAAELKTASVGSAEVYDGSLKLRDLHTEVKNDFREKAYAMHRADTYDNRISLPDSPNFATVAHLDLPPGKYVVDVTLGFEGTVGQGGQYDIICELGEPNQSAEPPLFEEVTFELETDYTDREVVPMNYAGPIGAGGIEVQCRKNAPNVTLQASPQSTTAVITAVQIDTLSGP